jgi:enterochelin esterase-like enzyme
MNALWSISVSSGPLFAGVITAALVLAIVLLLRRSPRWPRRAAVGLALGALTALLLLWLVVNLVNVFQVDFTAGMWLWITAGTAAVGLALASFRGARRWRRVVSTVAVPVFLLGAALGVNAEFGLNKTLGSVFGISTVKPVTLPAVLPSGAGTAVGPLWQQWQAPAAMPTAGRTGTANIPATASTFKARPAGIYLPPAALTANPPRLPLVVMMMGQPGAPDPSFVAAVLDRYATAHAGLGPIVVVADQLGPDEKDTLCLDSKAFGKVETYINTDVLTWAQAHLNVLPGRSSSTIAGYSNGGQCAISFGVKHPDLWGNILDISGEEFPGAEHPEQNLATVFGGDQKAYDAQKPLDLVAGKTFPNTTAVFTAGSDDTAYVATAQKVSSAARDAGMTVTYFEVPKGGHTVVALNGGLDKGFEVLFPRWGLAQEPG